MTNTRRWRWVRAAAAALLGLSLGIAFATRAEKAPSGADPSIAQRRLSLQFPTPLGNADSISPLEAAQAINSCHGCIALPSSGPGSVDDIAYAWSRSSDQAIAIDYKDGLRLYSWPDERSGEDWAKAAVASDGKDLAGTIGLQLIGIRNTLAVGIPASDTGPAALSWIEDGLMIEMLGKGAQSLDEPTKIADSFGGASDSAA